MPMAMENLSTAHYHDILRYVRIRSGAYRPQLQRFRHGVYVYLQREAPTTLDVRAGRTIVRMKEVLPSGLWLLEGKDGRKCLEHSKNYAPCHLPIEGTVHPELASCQRILHVLCVERRNERLLCSCVISVNAVGTWHA